METLADWIQRRGPLPPNEAVGWIIRLAKHVEALHEHGVAHGNVSPACVLLAAADPRTPGFMSDVRKTIESLPFHSPERIRGGQISPSDDVWAVAATLYTALTAAPPFVGANDDELRQQVLKGAPAPLSVYGVDDDRLERLMGMSFAVEAGRRLSNVALFRRELERVHPSPVGLEALEDEEVGDEDQAATAMLAVGAASSGGADSRGAASMKALFAPPSFQVDSAVSGGRAAPLPPAEGGDLDTNPPPPAAGDATVMRELPAHIMAMAARAAAGSNPPPADPAAEKQPAPPSAPKPAAGPPRPAPPSAPRPPLAPPRVPQFSPAQGGPGFAAGQDAISAAQTVAVPVPAPPRPQAPVAPVAPIAPTGPRPGFSPPVSGADRDPDDVRTVMHAGDIRSLLDASGPAAQAAPPPAPGASPFGPASPPRPQPPSPPGRPPIPPASPSQQMQAPLVSGGTARPGPTGGTPASGPVMSPGPAGPRPAPSTQMGLGAAEVARAAAPAEPRLPSTNSALEDEDEDDGARTVMRESPILSPMQLGPRPAAGGLAKRPSQDEPTQSESEFASNARGGFSEAKLAAENSFAGGAPGAWGAPPPAHGAPAPGGPPAQPGFQSANQPGVSALIAEALDAPKGDAAPSPAAPNPEGGAFGAFGGPINAPPHNPGFGAPNAGGFGSSPQPGGFGQQPGFGQGGAPFGGQPGPQGFGANNAAGGFGATPPQNPQGAFGGGFGQNQAGFGDAAMAQPGPHAHQPAFPTGEPTTSGPAIKLKQGRSYGSLILICVLVLVLAAAVTFIVLKYRDKLGLGALDAPTHSWPTLVADARLLECARATDPLPDGVARPR